MLVLKPFTTVKYRRTAVVSCFLTAALLVALGVGVAVLGVPGDVGELDADEAGVVDVVAAFGSVRGCGSPPQPASTTASAVRASAGAARARRIGEP